MITKETSDGLDRKQGAPRAYLQVADRLREEIISGLSAPGDRLLTEAELCKRFSVSRSTIREALRVLASQGLIVTNRGATGGSRVVRLDHHDVMAMLRLSIRALTTSAGVTESEMDEVREVLEVTASWLAAARRTPEQLQRLQAAIPASVDALSFEEKTGINKDFHTRVLECAGNRLLHLLADPVSVLIEIFVTQHEHPAHFWTTVTAEHQRIVDAISARDSAAARLAMSDHLAKLRSYTRGLPARSQLAGLSFDLG